MTTVYSIFRHNRNALGKSDYFML
ncbi:MAG: DUF1993 domain-containing protein [Leptospira sp.]|nr:DUF1993 domain-containing protein [Leptospira sp.]NCS92323.1 DUF1993 domain-containing protein [Leptospira sp.]